MIKEGRKAPAFNLPSSTGGKLALKDLAGKYVIVYFYPRDNTPGCRTTSVRSSISGKRSTGKSKLNVRWTQLILAVTRTSSGPGC